MGWKSKEDERAYYLANRDKIIARAKAHYRVNSDKKKKYASDRRLEQKLKAMALLGGKCSRCSQDHPAALDFHHLDPALKRFRISDAVARAKKYPWEDVVEEVMKCILLCKNCHAIEHATWIEW